jgi:hypothetical protein
MQYVALIYDDESMWETLSAEERGAIYGRYLELAQEARAAGVMVGGNELTPTAGATTVRVRDGQLLRRNEGDARWFLPLRVRHDRRGTGVGGQDPGGNQRRSRGSRRPAGPRRDGPAACRLGGRVMKYALLVYTDPASADSPPEHAAAARAEALPGWFAAFAQIAAVDPDWTGIELVDPADAKVITERDGLRSVSDGPYADTREVIGGLFLTELPDLDEAIRIASIVPASAYGSIEIRPIADR